MTDPQQLAALKSRILSVTSLAKSGRYMGAIEEAVALSRQFPLSRDFYTMLFTLLKWHDDQALAYQWAKRASVVFPERAEPYAILDRIAFERGAYVEQLSLAVWQTVLADASRYQELQNHLLGAAINVYGVGLAKNAGLTEHPCFSFVETFTEEGMGQRDPEGDLQAITQGNIELPQLSTKGLQHLLSGDVETSRQLFEAYEEKRGSAPPMSPIVRKKFQNIGAPIQDVYYPYSVHFESVNACNAACVMCPVSSTARKVNRMREELFFKMVDEVSSWPIDASIGLHGVGEPLLHKEIAKRVAYVRSKNIEVGFSTNGALLDEKRGRALLEAGISQIIFSLESLKAEIFEDVRIGLKHAAVIGNFQRFIEMRNEGGFNTQVRVAMIRTEDTHDEVMQFLEFWGSKLKSGDKVILHPRHNFTFEFSDKSASDTPCTSPFQQINVTSDGLVTACCLDSEQRMVLGDANEESLLDIFNGQKFSDFRQAHLRGQRKRMAACETCNAPEAWRSAQTLGV